MGLKFLSDVLDKMIRILAIVLLSLMFANVFGTAALRYLLDISFVGSYDYSRILFVWSTFLGTSVVYKQRGHAKFVFLHMRTKGGVRVALDLIINVLSIAFLVVILNVGMKLSASTSVQVLPASGISAAWLYVPIAVSAFVMLIHELTFLLTKIFAADHSKQETNGTGTAIGGIKNI